MQCQQCGSQDFWDNRETKTNPKQPDYKCKQCGKAIWLQPKGAKSGGYSKPVRQSPPPNYAPDGPDQSAPPPPELYAEPQEIKQRVQSLYLEHLEFVLASVIPPLEEKGIPCDMTGVNAACATLMIQQGKAR